MMTRKAVIWLVVIIAAYFVIKILFGIALNFYKSSNPAQQAPPNVLFGPIPAPRFPDTLKSTAGIKFNLLTIEGRPTEATSAARVYFMPKKLPSLLAPQKAREMAQKLGFAGEPDVISSTLYRFSEPGKSLDLDIVNNNFNYQTNLKQNPAVFDNNNPLTSAKAAEAATNFFHTSGVVDESMLSSNIVHLYHYDSGNDSFILTA